MAEMQYRELNEKLNNWAGTDCIGYTNSLEACFKWLIPEYLKRTNLPHKEAIKELFCAWVEGVFYHSPPEALSLVFEKLIDQEAKQ